MVVFSVETTVWVLMCVMGEDICVEQICSIAT